MPTFVSSVPDCCSRFPAGSVVRNPPALFSRNGSLNVNLSYQMRTDSNGLTLFSFMTPEGLENPTFHVRPGDHLIINLTNNTPASPVEMTIPSPNACGDIVMTASSSKTDPFQPGQSAGHCDDPGIGRGLDRPEPNIGES
jgi:hypothetical protein